MDNKKNKMDVILDMITTAVSDSSIRLSQNNSYASKLDKALMMRAEKLGYNVEGVYKYYEDDNILIQFIYGERSKADDFWENSYIITTLSETGKFAIGIMVDSVFEPVEDNPYMFYECIRITMERVLAYMYSHIYSDYNHYIAQLIALYTLKEIEGRSPITKVIEIINDIYEANQNSDGKDKDFLKKYEVANEKFKLKSFNEHQSLIDDFDRETIKELIMEFDESFIFGLDLVTNIFAIKSSELQRDKERERKEKQDS